MRIPPPGEQPWSIRELHHFLRQSAGERRFYSSLFAAELVEAFPTFGLFVLDGGLRFGLWSKHTVELAASASLAAWRSIAVSEGDVGDASRWVERGCHLQAGRHAWTGFDFFVALILTWASAARSVHAAKGGSKRSPMSASTVANDCAGRLSVAV